jgi:hypothetical protein
MKSLLACEPLKMITNPYQVRIPTQGYIEAARSLGGIGAFGRSRRIWNVRKRTRQADGNLGGEEKNKMKIFQVTSTGDSPLRLLEFVTEKKNAEFKAMYASFGYTSQSLEVDREQFEKDVLPGLVSRFEAGERKRFQTDLPDALEIYEQEITEKFEDELPASVKRFTEGLIGAEDAAVAGA